MSYIETTDMKERANILTTMGNKVKEFANTGVDVSAIWVNQPYAEGNFPKRGWYMLNDDFPRYIGGTYKVAYDTLSHWLNLENEHTAPIEDVLTVEEVEELALLYVYAPEDDDYGGTLTTIDGQYTVDLHRSPAQLAPFFEWAREHEEVVRKPLGLPYRTRITDTELFNTADEMRDHLQRHGEMCVSAEYTDTHMAWGIHADANLNFRIAHDFHHCLVPHTENHPGCDFNLWGEICAFYKFAKLAEEYFTKASPYYRIAVDSLFSELGAKICAVRVFGEWHSRRVVKPLAPYADKVIAAYDAAHS